MKGLVIKKNANLFSVEEISTGKVFHLNASGKTQNSGIFVGDYVIFDKNIEKVEERKNVLIRPPICNLDIMFIVLSCVPKPDLVLVDKMIVYCFVKGIKPIIVINKIDKAENSFVENIKNTYNKVASILTVSAKNGQIEGLIENIKGITAFAGQSAVGKSSLINAIFSKNMAHVDGLSSKIQRGKQTTRLVQLYKVGQGYIADTAGFSMLALDYVTDLEPRELSSYYPDFLTARAKCKYRSCLHESGECGVINMVKEEKISSIRYQNYLKILQELKSRKKY